MSKIWSYDKDWYAHNDINAPKGWNSYLITWQECCGIMHTCEIYETSVENALVWFGQMHSVQRINIVSIEKTGENIA